MVTRKRLTSIDRHLPIDVWRSLADNGLESLVGCVATPEDARAMAAADRAKVLARPS